MKEISFDKIVKVIEGGRITLPKDYREENRIEKGTRMAVTEKGRKLTMEPIPENAKLKIPK